MRILTGDECGLLKESIPELGRRPGDDDPNKLEPQKSALLTEECVNRIDPNEEQSRSRGVVDMTYFGNTSTSSDGNASFAAMRTNGTVELWEGADLSSQRSFGNYRRYGLVRDIFKDPSSSEETNNDEATENAKPSFQARPLGLECCNNDRLVAADTSGRISILPTTGAPVVAQYSPFAQHVSSKIMYTKGCQENVHICTAMAVNNHTKNTQERVALGGRERSTTILDIETGNVVWKAKNLPPDPQTLLQQPIWSTSLLFLKDSQIMAAGEAYKQVRLYDVRADSKTRRPISFTPEGLLSHRVTALCQVDEYHLVVGDAAGELLSLDTRILGKKQKTSKSATLGRYPGPCGSIRQIKRHESLPLLAVVGLDRMLRTYDIRKRKQVDCIYLKQRLNCVLFGNDGTWSLSEKDSDMDGGMLIDDDGDIDQEDNVQDYVDSEDEDGNDGDSAVDQDIEEADHDQNESDQDGSIEDASSEDSDDDEEESEETSDEDVGSDEDDESDDDDEPIRNTHVRSEASKKKKRRQR